MITYANTQTLIKYNYKNLILLHQIEVSMVGEGGRSEKKTAYFYERAQVCNNEGDCDSFFLEAYAASRLDIGDKYQLLMKQRSLYHNKHSKMITRNNKLIEENDYFIAKSDEETVG